MNNIAVVSICFAVIATCIAIASICDVLVELHKSSKSKTEYVVGMHPTELNGETGRLALNDSVLVRRSTVRRMLEENENDTGRSDFGRTARS